MQKYSFAVYRLLKEFENLPELENTSHRLLIDSTYINDSRFTYQVLIQGTLFSANIDGPIDIEIGKHIAVSVFTLNVTEGIYSNKTFKFSILVPKEYPFRSPRIICQTRIFHPNIDDAGNVCLEILKLGWSSGFGLENIFVNLCLLLVDFKSDDALNTVAGDMMKTNYDEFLRLARNS